MSQDHRKVTFADLLQYIHSEIIKWLEEEADESGLKPGADPWRIQTLGGMLSILTGVAERHKDSQLYELADDMAYVVHETSMGARMKGDWVLYHEVEPKLQAFMNERG